MKRKLSVERLYTLGDYRNIKIINEITDVPEELVNLTFQQLTTECDQAYEDYKAMNEERKNAEDVREFLKSEKERIAQELESGDK